MEITPTPSCIPLSSSKKLKEMKEETPNEPIKIDKKPPYTGLYLIHIMTVVSKKGYEEVKILDKIKVKYKEIKTIKDLKYFIIDKYKKNNFCPCILIISVPFEDGYFCSEFNDTLEKNTNECFPDGKIYININYKKKCDCGFSELNSLSKRQLFEIYNKKICELQNLLEREKFDKEHKIKDLEEINQNILVNFEKMIKKEKIEQSNTPVSSSNKNFYQNIVKFGESNFSDLKFENFYDIIINIKSVKDINIGWEIKMNENGLSRFNEYKKTDNLIIGIIGNSNKGKSYLLSKISKINLPAGTSIRTEGLSIKYPELEKYKNRKIVLLDSEGLDTPLLIKKEYILNTQNKNDLNDLLKEKAREKLITELFIQNFIIYSSDILITVVGILTYSEQKLLNRIKIEMIRAQLNNKKTLYIIHNLMTYTSIKQVEQYIQTYLINSATFDLKERTEISSKIGKEKNVPYYYEANNKLQIWHLIFANDGSEAGNFYNQFTIDFFENCYQMITDIQPFDIIQRLKERFIEVSKEIFEKNENNLSIEEKDFLDDENIIKEKKIRLKNKKTLVLKRYYIDELGFSNLRNNGFNPYYNYYKTDDKLIIRLEAPGNISIKTDIKYAEKKTIINVKGIKKIDKQPKQIEDNIFNSREFGEFSFDVPLIINLANKAPIIKKKEGIFIIEYELLEKNSSIMNFIFSGNEDDI